jgi:putative acetyltransferase
MTIALRPYLPADAEALALIYKGAILFLAEDDYGDDQLAAWASFADDAGFGVIVAGNLTLVSLSDGEPTGFLTLKDDREVSMLYVHPEFARQGVATALLDAAEKIAAARGSARLVVDASDTARGFFEARGYAGEQRLTREVAGEWLGATRMGKALAAPAAGRA